jgi:transposase
MASRCGGLWPRSAGSSAMFGLGAATHIYVATGATDMRLSFDGLYSLVIGQIRQSPQSGHLFLFANKRKDRMKIYFYDGSSAWVCARRMEQGRMRWPSSADGHVQLTQAEFAMLLGGIDLAETKQRKWLRQPLDGATEISRKSA